MASALTTAPPKPHIMDRPCYMLPNMSLALVPIDLSRGSILNKAQICKPVSTSYGRAVYQ